MINEWILWQFLYKKISFVKIFDSNWSKFGKLNVDYQPVHPNQNAKYTAPHSDTQYQPMNSSLYLFLTADGNRRFLNWKDRRGSSPSSAENRWEPFGARRIHRLVLYMPCYHDISLSESEFFSRFEYDLFKVVLKLK